MSAPAEEQYFPRGKVTGDLSTVKKSKKTTKRKQNGDLFKVINTAKKTKTKKGKPKKGEDEEDKIDEDIIIEPLSQKTIQTEMVILGVVHNIHEEMLRISLPGCVAHLPAANLSNSYNGLIKSWASRQRNHKRRMGEEELAKLVSLDELFKVGQVIKVAVRFTPPNRPVILSAIPSEVNGSLSREKLRNGMVIQAAVSSVEDHGYAVETGIEGLETAFIAANSVDSVMFVGQILLVRVSIHAKGGRLKLVPHKFDYEVQDGDWNLNLIMPGMLIQATVIQNDESGVGLWLLADQLMGAVEPRQIPKDLEITVGSKISAIVLYKHPILDTVYCSLRVPLIDEKNPFLPFHGLCPGQLIPKAIVVQVAPTYIKLEIPVKKLKTSVIAFATKDNISDDETKEPSDLFSCGQVTECRILGLSLMEGEAYVSLRQSVLLDGSYHTENELVVGKTLTAKVKYTNDTGIIFDICAGVVGFCDFAEASTVVNKKNAADLYPKGKPCQVRIRYINGKHHPRRFFVTANKQLISSKTEIIQSYATSNIGKVSDGIVLMVKPRGVLVGFYGKVRGWVPEEFLPRSWQDATESVRVGQVVTARIMSIVPEANKMTLSLRNHEDPTQASTNSVNENSTIEFRTNLSGVIVDKTEDAVKLKMPDVGVATLPVHHLSDFSDLSREILGKLKRGDRMEDLTTFGREPRSGVALVSAKPYLKSMALGGLLKDLNVGSVIPTTIETVFDGGVILRGPNNVSAKISKKDLSDSFTPKLCPALRVGKTVVCKIVAVSDGPNLKLASKQSEVQYAVDAALKDSLATSIRRSLAYEQDDCIGKVVKVVPKSVAGSKLICEFKGLGAVASAMLTTDGQVVGGVPTNALVLGCEYLDSGKKRYIVSVDRDSVYKYLQVHRRNRKSSKPPVKCKVDTMVIAVLNDYAATITKDGRLLLLTLGNHFNDFRLGKWTQDDEEHPLPRFVQAWVHEMVGPAIAVGNFCKAEGVKSKVAVHQIKRLSESGVTKSDFNSLFERLVADHESENDEDYIGDEFAEREDGDEENEEASDSDELDSGESVDEEDDADMDDEDDDE